MKIELANQKKNPLLGRKEVEFQIVAKITPSRQEVKAELTKALKAKDNLVVIDIVDQKSGSNLIVGRAKVYDNEKVMNKLELDYKSKRGVKEKKEEAAPAPAPAEVPAEAPAEEAKEEAPVEEKTEEKSE